MKKNVFNQSLLAALFCGLCFSFAACSDDDKESFEGEVGGETTMSTDMTDDETVLASLLQQWCGVMPEDIHGGIWNKTFEPVVGEIIDPSHETVRTLVMGTDSAANAYVVTALSALGVNPADPVGFRYNGSLGTVSYERSTNNELGVIEVNIRQIPMLEKIRLVRTSEGNDGEGVPYYRKGDVVRYTGSGKMKGKLFICLNDHLCDQPSNWLSFDYDEDYKKRTVKSCSWAFTGDDYYYSEAQASLSSLFVWLESFVANDAEYDEIVAGMKAGGASDDDVNRIVPSTDAMRATLLRSLIAKPETMVLDAWEAVSSTDARVQAIAAEWARLNVKSKSGYAVDVYRPCGLLLTGNMRWAMGMVYNYWQPYVTLQKSTGSNVSSLLTRIRNAVSQTTLNPSHFQSVSMPNMRLQTRVLNFAENGNYALYQVAVHWTHTEFKLPDSDKLYYGLIDFTKADASKDYDDWTRRNITSTELTVTDEGNKYKYFEDVYRQNK